MFLIFVRISRTSLFFLECPPRILGGFTWRLQMSLQLVIVRFVRMEGSYHTFDPPFKFVTKSSFWSLVLGVQILSCQCKKEYLEKNGVILPVPCCTFGGKGSSCTFSAEPFQPCGNYVTRDVFYRGKLIIELQKIVLRLVVHTCIHNHVDLTAIDQWINTKFKLRTI